MWKVLILQASSPHFLSSVDFFIYGRIFPSICVCQPLSFSCIFPSISHYFFSVSALTEEAAAAAVIQVKRHLIRRLNWWRSLMANQSAYKNSKTIISASASHICFPTKTSFAGSKLYSSSSKSKTIQRFFISPVLMDGILPILFYKVTSAQVTVLWLYFLSSCCFYSRFINWNRMSWGCCIADLLFLERNVPVSVRWRYFTHAALPTLDQMKEQTVLTCLLVTKIWTVWAVCLRFPNCPN